MLFAIGAILLIRESLTEPEHAEFEEMTAVRAATPAWRVALTSFGVLFAAEWGDASQIATAGLVARGGEAVAVALGAWTALVSVAVVAVGAGKLLVRRVPVRIVHAWPAGCSRALLCSRPAAQSPADIWPICTPITSLCSAYCTPCVT